jgi:hypothetical protein
LNSFIDSLDSCTPLPSRLHWRVQQKGGDMVTILAQGVKLCPPDTATPPEVPPAPPPEAPAPVVRPAAGDKRGDFPIELEPNAKIHIWHERCPGPRVGPHKDCVNCTNTVHRYVVITDPALCAQLNRPAREQIDDLVMEGLRWSEAQMRERATLEGQEFLRLLAPRATLPVPAPATEPPAAAPTRRRVRVHAQSVDVRPAEYTTYAGEARGLFIRKGRDEHGVFVFLDGVRLDGNGSSEEQRQLLRYSDMSLFISVAEQNVQPGQSIHIRPTGEREVTLVEQRSGACGQGEKKRDMKITLWEVHVLQPRARGDFQREPRFRSRRPPEPPIDTDST